MGGDCLRWNLGVWREVVIWMGKRNVKWVNRSSMSLYEDKGGIENV